MKQIYIFFQLCLFFSAISLQAQVKYYAPSLSPYQFKPSDVLMGTMQNYMPSDVDVRLKSRVSVDGKVLFEIESNTFRLAKTPNPMLVLSPVNVGQWIQDIDIHFLDIQMQEVIGRTGFLPANTYQICTTIYEGGTQNPISEEVCYPHTLIQTAPPILISPNNQAMILHQNPLFTWSYTQLSAFSDNTTILTIKALFSGQSEQEAMAGNPVLFEQEVTNRSFLQYPLNAPKWDSCSHYVWQIKIYDGKKVYFGEDDFLNKKFLLAQSEIFSFSVACPAPVAKMLGLPERYYVLQKNLSEEYHVVQMQQGNNLSFKYEEKYENATLNYAIYNWKRELIPPQQVIPNVYQQLFYTLPITGLPTNEVYTLEVKNAKGEVYKMKFLLIP